MTTNTDLAQQLAKILYAMGDLFIGLSGDTSTDTKSKSADTPAPANPPSYADEANSNAKSQ